MSNSDISSLSLSSELPNSEHHEEEKTNPSNIFDRYKEKVTQFPKEKGWMCQDLYKYQGFWYTSGELFSIETTMAMQESFQARPTDIYLLTQQKSGTTWLKALVFAIVNRKRYENNKSTHPLLKSNPHKCVPFLDIEFHSETPTYLPENEPRLFATHIPYVSLPQSIHDSGCRLVYLCRNPKDALVSWFHFGQKLDDKDRAQMTMDELSEVYIKGLMPYGPYWDHVIEYYRASCEHPTRILFLTYEDMTKDIANKVRLLAEFLGYPFTEEEKANGVVEEIVALCSFENLKEVNKHGNFIEGVPNNAFFREGKVGGSSNHLTNEISKIMDDITMEKFQGLDISI